MKPETERAIVTFLSNLKGDDVMDAHAALLEQFPDVPARDLNEIADTFLAEHLTPAFLEHNKNMPLAEWHRTQAAYATVIDHPGALPDATVKLIKVYKTIIDRHIANLEANTYTVTVDGEMKCAGRPYAKAWNTYMHYTVWAMNKRNGAHVEMTRDCDSASVHRNWK